MVRVVRMTTLLALALLACSCATDTVAVRADPAGADSAAILQDLSGQSHRPMLVGDKGAAVLFFVLSDCPICNEYAPEINRIVSDYQKRAVAAYVVHVDRDVSIEELRKHANEYGYTCPVLVDSDRSLAKRVGVGVAPEAAVIGPGGKVQYVGRIDDRYASLGKQRIAATTHEVRDAIDAVLSGKSVEVKRVKAIGCAL